MNWTVESHKREFIKDAQGVTDCASFCDKPYYLPSRANRRAHWVANAKLDKESRQVGQWMTALAIQEGSKAFGWMPTARAQHPCASGRWSVRMIRFGPRNLDSDNLVGAFKSLRDGIADVLGLGDHWDGRITWHYDQRLSRAFGVRIELARLSET